MSFKTECYAYRGNKTFVFFFPDESPGKHDTKLIVRNINKSPYNCVRQFFLCCYYVGFVVG